MEQLPIVRRRVRIWPILLTLIVIALLIAGAFYVLGDRSVAEVGALLPVDRVAGVFAHATRG